LYITECFKEKERKKEYVKSLGMRTELITQIWPILMIRGIAVINTNRNPVPFFLNKRDMKHAI